MAHRWTTSWTAFCCGCVTEDIPALICGLWLNNFYKILDINNIKTSTWILSPPTWTVLNPYQRSRLDIYTDWRSVIYHYVSVPVPPIASRGLNRKSGCASVPHGARTVCNGRFFCIFSSCDGPEAVGEIQRLSLQSIDYSYSLTL